MTRVIKFCCRSSYVTFYSTELDKETILSRLGLSFMFSFGTLYIVNQIICFTFSKVSNFRLRNSSKRVKSTVTSCLYNWREFQRCENECGNSKLFELLKEKVDKGVKKGDPYLQMRGVEVAKISVQWWWQNDKLNCWVLATVTQCRVGDFV